MEGKIGKYQFDSELSLDDLSKTYVSQTACSVVK